MQIILFTYLIIAQPIYKHCTQYTQLVIVTMFKLKYDL
jgi:hypothetical protein